MPDIPHSAAWAEMLARLAFTNTRLSKRLETGNESRSRSMVQELERERSRIARDLHAGAGQPLAGIQLNLELLEGWSQNMPEPARDAVSRLRILTAAALEQIRAVSHRLYPPEWQELTTDQAIRGMIFDSGVATSFETIADIEPLPIEPSHTVKIVLYRCAQECISNVLRHSGAKRVTVSLIARGARAELRIADDGRGLFNRSGEGMGLKAIREHTASVGGTCHIEGAAGGTTITIEVPIARD